MTNDLKHLKTFEFHNSIMFSFFLYNDAIFGFVAPLVA